MARLMGSLVKKRRERMRKKKHKKLLRRTRHQRRKWFRPHSVAGAPLVRSRSAASACARRSTRSSLRRTRHQRRKSLPPATRRSPSVGVGRRAGSPLRPRRLGRRGRRRVFPRPTTWRRCRRAPGDRRRDRRSGRATARAAARPRARPARGRSDRRQSDRRDRPTPGTRRASTRVAAGRPGSRRGRSEGSGSTISPIPCTRARPPTRQKAMSAPSCDATTRSSKPAHASTAAASADPPPSPPPLGIRLSIVTWAVTPASRSALATRLRPSTGTPAPNRPLTASPSPSGSIAHARRRGRARSSRRRSGGTRRPDAGDPQRHGELGGAPRSSITSSAPLTGARRAAGPRRRRTAPPAGRWFDAGGGEVVVVGHTGERPCAASCGAD